MNEIRPYIEISTSSKLIEMATYEVDEFVNFFRNASDKEIESITRHFLIDNIPFAFIEKPILFEQIKQFFSDKYKIKPFELKIIGSAKTGFSMSPFKVKGKKFDNNSDLDLVIINEFIFNALNAEFFAWKVKYESGEEKPSNRNEADLWEENVKRVPKNLGLGFIDLNKIPLKKYCRFTLDITNDLYLLKIDLAQISDFRIKALSIRVYRDHESFYRRLKFNIQCFVNYYNS